MLFFMVSLLGGVIALLEASEAELLLEQEVWLSVLSYTILFLILVLLKEGVGKIWLVQVIFQSKVSGCE